MKTHRPALGLLLFLSAGILIGHFMPVPLKSWLVITGLLTAVTFFWPNLGLMYAAVFLLGGALIHVAHPPAMDILHDWRELLKQSLYQYLDPDQAGTMSAIILGDRSAIPKEINMVFRHTGTGHILVIAGLHMAMMTAMVIFVLKIIRMPRPWQAGASIALIFMYAILVGGSIPVMRAAFMAAVFLAAGGMELESDGLNSLCLAALSLLLMNAQDLFDASFQLSFAAVGAIIFWCRPMEQCLSFCPPWLAASMAVSTTAWIGITPFQLAHFGTITPIALIANLFIVPLLDLTVALGLCLTFAGLWTPSIAWMLAGCLKVVFNLMVVLGFWFSQIPFGYFQAWQPTP